MDDKNYDIRDILNKAKNDRGEEEDDRYRNLQNTGYDLLKTMKLKEEEAQFSDEEIEHLGDTTLSLSLFDQLDDEEGKKNKNVRFKIYYKMMIWNQMMTMILKMVILIHLSLLQV